jgi:RNA polymerase sigma factor (sigma-70 family)
LLEVLLIRIAAKVWQKWLWLGSARRPRAFYEWESLDESRHLVLDSSLMKATNINQEGFDRFLACLDADREKAGLEYERIRGRLLLYFQCRNLAQAEDCADEALNRVMDKLGAGETIREPAQYVFGIARLILLEVTRQQSRRQEIEGHTLVTEPAPEAELEQNARLACLRGCLQRLPPEQRDLLLQYYQEEKRAKINLRQQLAERYGIDLNSSS